ncbi:MAG: translation initiation factor IF-2 [Cyanobacteria bacterium REEB67]|nr:translation initiation factor IF-2 [Cyanobacteria bacterium REEB67]
MDDRVRIYELARRMNVPNGDVITVLRELGYDIKSHSSTIDKTAVGLLIAAIDKKKQKADNDPKGKAKAASVTTTSKSPAAKAPAKLPPPPEPVVVKPRVLARYRPEKPPVDGDDSTTSSGMISGSHQGVPIGTGLSGMGGTPTGHVVQSSNAGASAPHSNQGAQSSPQSSQGANPINAQTQISSRPITSSGHSSHGSHGGGHQTGTTSGYQAGAVASQGAAQAASGSMPAPTKPADSASAQPAARVEHKSAAGHPASPESNPGAVREQESNQSSTASAPHGQTAEAAPTAAEPVAPEVEEVPLDTRGKVTGDSWSDESRYAPRSIRKLDQPQAPKVKTPDPKAVAKAKAEEEAAAKAAKETAAKEAKSKTKEERDKDKDKDDFSPRGQAVRPMSPSVPIRVAAPSMRATPPRPPKSRHQTPADRHAPKKEEKVRPAAAPEVPKVIVLTTNLTVQELAAKMQVPETEVIKRLFMKGIARTVNMIVELEIARDLAVEMEYEVLSEEEVNPDAVKEEVPELSDEDKAALVSRPPVVTIMGHVDHGKTSLLDAIRQTKFLLTDSEHGGITQHIGAYHVEVPDEEGHMRQIVFLDTPGHEAFSAMRARGANVTDIAILVVAADDGVMPQTIEAIDHVKAAGVPIIVAVNKIDKAGADPEKVLSQLMNYELVAEKYGGQTVTVEVSAKKRTGLDQLLEMILLVSDVLELKANPEKPAVGVIIEAELSRGKGAVATALVENGTLREGDFIVAGSKCGRVRALFDDREKRVKAAGPSMPVQVLGLDEVPQAGDTFQVVSDAQGMKMLAEAHRLTEGSRAQHHVTLESLHELLERGEVKDLNIIVKADVQGTAEAIADTIRKLGSGEVQTRILRTASGDISENDVNLAASSNAIIVGFNVNPDQNASRVAEGAGVDIRTYSIIYQITDDITSAIQGLLKPIREEVNIGQAEVRQIFKVGKGTIIAGCMVLSGKVQRSSLARIERNGAIIFEGKLDTLKRFKDDAKEVAQGFECGMSFDKFSDLQIGDKINSYIVTEKKQGGDAVSSR